VPTGIPRLSASLCTLPLRWKVGLYCALPLTYVARHTFSLFAMALSRFELRAGPTQLVQARQVHRMKQQFVHVIGQSLRAHPHHCTSTSGAPWWSVCVRATHTLCARSQQQNSCVNEGCGSGPCSDIRELTFSQGCLAPWVLWGVVYRVCTTLVHVYLSTVDTRVPRVLRIYIPFDKLLRVCPRLPSMATMSAPTKTQHAVASCLGRICKHCSGPPGLFRGACSCGHTLTDRV
jgi:hypothetical protein